MKIILTAALAFALAAPMARAETDQPQTTEQKGTPSLPNEKSNDAQSPRNGTTAAIPNDNANSDTSQTTAQPIGQTPAGGVASNPNDTNAKSAQPQEGMEQRARPLKKGQGKSSKSKMHHTRTSPDAADTTTGSDQLKDSMPGRTDGNMKDPQSGNLTPDKTNPDTQQK